MMAGTVDFDLGDNYDSNDDYQECLLLAQWRILQEKRRSVRICPIFSRRKQQREYHNLLQEMYVSQILNLTLDISGYPRSGVYYSHIVIISINDLWNVTIGWPSPCS